MKKTINISVATILISIFGTAHAEIIQFGKMREALAEGKTESRAVLSEITKKPHFYGVGALEGLKGEVAVIDGDVISTQAISSSEIDTKKQSTPTKATYLVGGYIPEWRSIQTASNLTTKELENLIEQTAAKNGASKKEPFMFMVEGKVESAEAHVIRGACPMHARMKRKNSPESEKPLKQV
ncbi:MAG: acetolactate decarboxylase [Bdellovibrionales bacterium]|nr:acetolactate decarboxylase [Bdellovibrionales bacterium]